MKVNVAASNSLQQSDSYTKLFRGLIDNKNPSFPQKRTQEPLAVERDLSCSQPCATRLSLDNVPYLG